MVRRLRRCTVIELRECGIDQIRHLVDREGLPILLAVETGSIVTVPLDLRPKKLVLYAFGTHALLLRAENGFPWFAKRHVLEVLAGETLGLGAVFRRHLCPKFTVFRRSWHGPFKQRSREEVRDAVPRAV